MQIVLTKRSVMREQARWMRLTSREDIKRKMETQKQKEQKEGLIFGVGC